MRTALLTVTTLVATLSPASATASASSTSGSSMSAAQGRPVWPSHGQAAYAIGKGDVHGSPRQRIRAIGDLAKVMTAYLVVRDFPMKPHEDGFRLRVRQRDVDDYERRRANGEPVVRVEVGERITERQALAALLLPSADNIAIMLARKVGGTVRNFVRMMNNTARRHDLITTTYSDPSGFEPGSNSTPKDQVTLARLAMHRTAVRSMVERRTYRIPVAGRIHNTNTLLGRHGFAGIKTASTDASRGCFMFLTYRSIDGRRTPVYGVVMGQPGEPVESALQAGRRFADRIVARENRDGS